MKSFFFTVVFSCWRMLRTFCLIFCKVPKRLQKNLRSCLLLLCSIFSMLTVFILVGWKWNLFFSLPLYFNPVHTCPKLFPCTHKGVSKFLFLFKMRGTSFWLVVLAADVWQSHSRYGVECVAGVIRNQGGTQAFCTGYERAEQISQGLHDSLQVCSKWAGDWDQTKPAWSTPAEDALVLQSILQRFFISKTQPILCSFDPGPQCSFIFLFLAPLLLFFIPLKVTLSQVLP